MRLLTRIRCDSGQALVFVAVALTVLVGMAGLVIDVGSWYRADRNLQTAADAAALAGAQELPTRQSVAKSTAEQYAQTNYAGMPTPTVTFPNTYTIDVAANADTPGIFAPVLNSAFDVVTVHAEAQATVQAPLDMKNVAPIAVKDTAACIVSNPDCFDKTVKVSFDESQISSSNMGLIDLRCQSSSPSVDCGGGPGASTLEGWIDSGYGAALPSSKWYDVKPGESIGPIRAALDRAVSARKVLFFPVFDDATSESFHVIGWAAFVIERVIDWSPDNKSCSPDCKVLEGHFETFIATDLAAGGPISDPNLDFGVHVITLTR